VSTAPIRIGDGPPRQGRAQRHELAGFEIAEAFRLATVHAEQIGGACHVDIEEGAAHQKVGGLGRHVLGELGEALRRDDARQAALAAAAHQIGHGAERQAARLVRYFAGYGGREDLCLVDCYQHRIPDAAVGIEQAVQEGGGAPHLLFRVEPLEIEDDGGAMLPDAERDALQLTGAAFCIDDSVAEALGEGDEIALGIDDRLLNHAGALLEQSAQKMRFAGTGIALHEKARGQQLLEVEHGRLARRIGPEFNSCLHDAPSPLRARRDPITVGQRIGMPIANSTGDPSRPCAWQPGTPSGPVGRVRDVARSWGEAMARPRGIEPLSPP
jgi:hypothetical protein